MTGEWRGPNDVDRLLAIIGRLDPLGYVNQLEFIRAMQDSGLILREAYYVPDADELLGMMRQLSYRMRGTRGVRWVMCRETLDALAEKYERKVAPAPARFDVGLFSGPDALPDAALELEVMTIIEHNRYWGDDKSQLFGIPIRIDPAARYPMFDVDGRGA